MHSNDNEITKRINKIEVFIQEERVATSLCSLPPWDDGETGGKGRKGKEKPFILYTAFAEGNTR